MLQRVYSSYVSLNIASESILQLHYKLKFWHIYIDEWKVNSLSLTNG